MLPMNYYNSANNVVGLTTKNRTNKYLFSIITEITNSPPSKNNTISKRKGDLINGH